MGMSTLPKKIRLPERGSLSHRFFNAINPLSAGCSKNVRKQLLVEITKSPDLFACRFLINDKVLLKSK